MEETKFFTKGKIITFIVVLAIIGIVVGLIFLSRAKSKKEYMRLETKFNNAAPNYLLMEKIELEDGEYKKINIKDILKRKIYTDERANDCSGYVIAENIDGKINYTTYLKCKNIYITPGYGAEITNNKKENTTKTQTEEDTTKPVITLLGAKKVTINVGDKYKDAGATAEDNIDGNLTNKIKKSGKVDTKKAGTYTIKYTVTDKAGNKASKSRIVIVKEGKSTTSKTKDTTPPVITFKNNSTYQKVCTGDKVNISKDGVYGYTAYDDVDKDLTSSVNITGQTDATNNVGEYILKYSVKDKAGNETTAERKYSVVSCNTQTNTSTNNTSSGSSNYVAPSTPSNSNSSSSSGGSSRGSSSSNTSHSSPSTTTGGSAKTNVIVQPTGISAPNSVTVSVGRTAAINASVLPSNATNKILSYRVLDSSVAIVDAGGIVTGVKVGTTSVQISTSNGKFKSVTIQVK